jgi:hypothetical protein
MSTFIAPSDVTALALARSANVNDLSSAVSTAFALLPDETRLKIGTVTYGTCSGSSNAYEVDLDSAPSGYTDGLSVTFKANHANDGAATLDVNSLGAKSLKLHGGGTLSSGDIVTGKFYTFRYNSSTGCFEAQQAMLSEITGGATVTVVTALVNDLDPELGGDLNVSTFSLVDANDNELLKFSATASAVNEITFVNAATGNGPKIQATGGDTNIDLILVPKGTGSVNLEDAVLKRPKMKDYSEVPKTVTSSAGVLDLDLEDGNNFVLALSENVTTFSISNWLTGTVQFLTIFLTQDDPARTVSWSDESILWNDGTEPDITTVSSVHIITIVSPDGGTTKYGFHTGRELS